MLAVFTLLSFILVEAQTPQQNPKPSAGVSWVYELFFEFKSVY